MFTQDTLDEITDRDLRMALADSLERYGEEPPKLSQTNDNHRIASESDAEYKLRCAERTRHIKAFIGALLLEMKHRRIPISDDTYNEVIRLFYVW